jgi:hypothetical protein
MACDAVAQTNFGRHPGVLSSPSTNTNAFPQEISDEQHIPFDSCDREKFVFLIL